MYALAAQSAGTNWVVLILVYVVIFGGFYMLFMRPQKKEQKRIQEMIAEMEVGDTVLTTSGFYGVIIDITDDDLIRTVESRCRKQQSHRLRKHLLNRKMRSEEESRDRGSSFSIWRSIIL